MDDARSSSGSLDEDLGSFVGEEGLELRIGLNGGQREKRR